jgi:hypothetical protein
MCVLLVDVLPTVVETPPANGTERSGFRGSAAGARRVNSVRDQDLAVARRRRDHSRVGPIEPAGPAGRKAIVVDPDGNTLSLIEVAAGA